MKEYRQINKDKIKEKSKIYRNKNIIRIKEHREANKTRMKQYRKINTDRIRAKNKQYKINNAGKVNATNAIYRSSKLNATPSWITKFDYDYIKFIYLQAKWLSSNFESIYHVDHIFPLIGENVSGLHVPTNLQIITASENCKKRNKSPDSLV